MKYKKNHPRLITIKTLLIILFLFFSSANIHPFGKNKVNREVFQWSILKTIHFDIYYPYGMEELAENAARISEDGYVHLANTLNHELTEVIPIIVYPSHIDFQENNIIPQIIGEGTGGFTEVFKNRVVLPFTGSYHEFRHVLVHELVHAFQYNILFYDSTGANISRFSLSGAPLWIMEGMAEYLSIGFDETADMIMRDILFNEKYATLIDLTQFQVRSPYLLYKEGQAFFYYFEKKYGKNIIGELLRDLRDMSDLERALRVRTGKKLKELSLEWIRFFKKRYYPIIKGKKFDEEEGEQLTFHEKTYSSFNVCPAVSPDGKKIAYITNRDIYSCVSIIDLEKKKKKERKIETLIKGETSARFEGMHLLNNNLSWSSDGENIVFVSQSNGRDVIFIIKADDSKIEREIKLPFRALSDPSLSEDGNQIAFIGHRNHSSDVYIYSIKERQLTSMTNDLFSERYPSISSDSSFIIFSSNWNSDGDYERDNYNIIKMDLKTRERTNLIDKEGNDLQADLSSEDKRILYISNRTGIYNVYKYNLETGADQRITNVLCGIFYPRWFSDGKKMAFVAYQNIGYDIFVKDIEILDVFDEDSGRDTEHLRIKKTHSYFNLSDSIFSEYTTRIGLDPVFGGFAGTVGGMFGGFLRTGFSDYMGDHRMAIDIDYFRYEQENNQNYNIIYYYLKNRWDFGFGIFRQSNPFGVISMSSINDLIHGVYEDTQDMEYYGAYSIARYPFSRFFRFDVKASSSRYEVNYEEEFIEIAPGYLFSYSEKPDTYANLNQVSLSLGYDNVLWGNMAPLDGVRGQIVIEQSFDITGQDYNYTSLDIDIRRYFFLSKRYVIALRGSGGKIFGEDSRFFKYYIGGFNTLRGHPFFEFSGKNVFLFNTEFRFIFIEGIKFGWPLFFVIGGIGGVLFVDCGSSWDKNYNFMDSKTEKFDDFKADMGFGFRFTLYPVAILKLDYAWPYYYRTFDDVKILFSLGFEY